MAQVKVRCSGCGAMNADLLADRCRICGNLLPNAHDRRAAKIGAATAGPAFNELVESEVGVWKEYDGRSAQQPRSRRPPEEQPTRHKTNAVTGNALLVLLAVVAGATVVFGAWFALVRKDGSTTTAASVPGIAENAWKRLDDPSG